MGEQIEHAPDLGGVNAEGFVINCAERAEETAVRQVDRDRDVARETVELGRVVIAVVDIGADVINGDGRATQMNLVAERSLNADLLPRLKAIFHMIQNTAGHPAFGGHSCHSGKAHARDAENHIENGGDNRDACNSLKVVGDRVQGRCRSERLLLFESSYYGVPIEAERPQDWA